MHTHEQSSGAVDFDIDVDVSPFLNSDQPFTAPTLVSSAYYEAARPRPGRLVEVQAKMNTVLRHAMLRAQWEAASKSRLERRKNVRVPLLSRVATDADDTTMLSCDISMDGLRCSGRPPAPVMDVEFKVPGAPFPIDARVELVRFKEANILPLAGLRFSWIDSVYLEYIEQFICKKQQQMQLAA